MGKVIFDHFHQPFWNKSVKKQTPKTNTAYRIKLEHKANTMENKASFAQRVINLYADGFREMPKWGKTLWLIILLKLFIMFFIFKLFFFRDTLKNKYATPEDRATHVIEQLTNTEINDGTH